ncbi:LAQU0S07e02806g1_1 [Lachancea quebecensis]|uniref:LAQU0S07e02806g1_1 n=1 Tax=Lachancea quebecensis TaxID=1654605 RepID=A0A0N7MLQ0_9SACH|nr:LAQU0S07e02806g1_1 [Lachancea quebecensis]
MVLLAPDELVQRLCEEIAYNGGKISLGGFWDLVTKITDEPDERMKIFVLRCFESHPDTAITKEDEILKVSNYKEFYEDVQGVTCTISEDRLYSFLTGYRKKECSVGGLAFELLVEIAKTKDKGINTMDLAQLTSQDPRSITGRIKKLGNLVSGVQTIYKGHVVKNLKFFRFVDGKEPSKSYTSMRDSLPKIVDVVKNSKNGVRQLIDLKRELKFDKDKRLSKSFIAAISSLDEMGYLKKVLVVSPSSPTVKIRCVKFLRDYVPEDRSANDFEDDESDAGEDTDGKQMTENGMGDEEDDSEIFSSENATQVLQERNFVVEDEMKPERRIFLLNRFFPFQNQTYALVDKHDKTGLSSMQAVNLISGCDYKRSFTKCSEYYIETVGKGDDTGNGFGLVRAYDFEGKKKFYRLFTKSHFQNLVSAQRPESEGTFRSLKVQHETLQELSLKSFSPLSNTIRFINVDGSDRFFWNGDLKVPANQNAAPRGRKRKQLKTEAKDEEVPKKIKQESKCAPEGTPDEVLKSNMRNGPEKVGVTVSEAGEAEKQKAILNIGGFSAGSLKSVQRQRAILEAVKRNGGVTFFRDQFFDDVTKLMESKTTLDKKTIRGDVELLRTTQKLFLKVDQSSGRRIMFLPNVSSEEISKFLVNEKDSKKSYFRDVIQNTDIYFFDQTQRDRFHRGKKSAERIKNFEHKSSNGRRIRASRTTKKPVKKLATGLDDSSVDRQSLVENNMAQYKSNDIIQTPCYNVGTKAGVRALIMSAVITKSLRGQILWELITKLFPNNSISNLKKQWTARRIRMGHGGWKGLLEKWRKVIVDAMKDERVTMEDVEQLELLKLVELWESTDQERSKQSITLFKSHDENLRNLTLVKEPNSSAFANSPDQSSMVQRETGLLRRCYTYESRRRRLCLPADDELRAIVRSILIDRSVADLEGIKLLDRFPRDDVDKTILEMAKEKQVSFIGQSKLQLTDAILDILHKKGDDAFLEAAVNYRTQLFIFLNDQKGLLLNEEIKNHGALVLIDLLDSGRISISEVPLLSQEMQMHYSTRKYEVGALTPPLLITQKIPESPSKEHGPIPVGEPHSRIWVDSKGSIRRKIWRKVVALVLQEICFNPGITLHRLAAKSSQLLSTSEISEVVSWCMKEELVSATPFEGLTIGSSWYSAF